ncbi:MAG: alcohol dehydrogenase catalytic domain-containing protein [Actinomycetia bacterium]|nr:alcohol dehydrogenase catalytic domain-containing protein [Actinomycetes bacterium]
MPELARALVLEAPRRLEAVEFHLPATGADTGVLRVEACGLCGTDHEQWSGKLHGGRPFIPGHESVGIIEQLGAAAAQKWGVSIGDRVAVEVFQRCGECPACLAGNYRLCANHGIGDMYGFVDVKREPHLWGGYASHQYLAPDTLLLPVPDSLDPVVATLFNPIGAGIRWGVTVPALAAGENVAILGPGIRGLSAAAAAREAGAGFIMVTGSGERDADRLAAATDFGADLVVDVARQDPAEAFRDSTGGGADVVVDVTANAPTAFAQAIRTAAVGGRVVVAGTRGFDAEAPGFHPDEMVYKELRVMGALGVDATAYTAALELLASHKYPFADLPRRVVGLDGAHDLLAAMAGESEETPPIHGVVKP